MDFSQARRAGNIPEPVPEDVAAKTQGYAVKLTSYAIPKNF